MKTYKKRIICFLAAVLALTMILPSCADTVEPADTAGATVADSDAATEAESVLTPPDIADVNLAGKTFTVLYRHNGSSYNMYDIYAEKMNGEAINDAVYVRNTKLQTDLGIELVLEENGTPMSRISSIGLSGDDEYDVAADSMTSEFSMSLNGYFRDWKKMTYYNPEDPWWDIHADEDLSIMDSLYLAVGNATMKTSSDTRLLFISKGIAEQYKLTVPYESVRNGTWIFDEYLAMVQAVYEDTNGDGKKDGDDVYGLLAEGSIFYICGCGVKMTEKDEDGLPTAVEITDRTVDIVDMIQKLSKDSEHTISYDRVASGKDTSGFLHIYDFGRSKFAENHFLFVQNGPCEVELFVEMKPGYGILPNPKYDVQQKEYHHLVDWYSVAWVMPAAVRDVDKADAVMSYWSYLSQDTLLEAFYETTIKSKRLNAPEDAEMLDIVLATRQYEIAAIADTGLLSMFSNASSGKGLMSSAAGTRKSANKKLNDIAKKYQKMASKQDKG